MNQDPRPSDRFEADVAAYLRQRSRVAPGDVDALADFARRVPSRRPAGLSLRHLWPAAVVTFLLLTVSVSGLWWGLGGAPGASERATATASVDSVAGSIVPSAADPSSPKTTPVASASSLPDPSRWSSDARLASCGGLSKDGTKVLTIVEIQRESDYASRLPSIGYASDLERAAPALIVVYDGSSPSDLSPDGGSGPLTHKPSPGTYDLCVGTADLHQRYTSVPIDWPVLTGSVSSTPPKLVEKLPATFNMYGSNLAWDQARHLLWYAVVGCGTASALHSIDPDSGTRREWSIPGNTFGNCDAPQIGVDPTGAVWVMENSLLVRLGPDLAKVASVRLAPEALVPSRTQATASFPTAMTFDGGDALVARFNTPWLTRVTPQLTTSTIPVPSSIAGARGLAVAGGRLYAATDLDVAVVPLEQIGTRTPTPSATPPVATVHGGPNGTLSARPDGVVVLWTSLSAGQELTIEGLPTVPVAIPSTPPYAWRATRVATDWVSRSWWVVGGAQSAILEAG